MPGRRATVRKKPNKKIRTGAVIPKEERRQQILKAARDVFVKRGYHQTTIDDIVAAAGVARGTYYLYFEDKRAVLADLIDRFAAQITMAIQRITTDEVERSVGMQVRENIRAVIGVCLKERSMTKILFTDATGVDSDFHRKLSTFYDSVVQLLTESLKDGQALGIVGEGEPRVLAYLTVGALKELLYQAVGMGLTEETTEVLTQQLFVFLSEGYLRVKPDQAPQRRRRAR